MLSDSGNGLNADETRFFKNYFINKAPKQVELPSSASSSSSARDEVAYMRLVEFMYPFRENILWDGDMTTVQKLRRICKLARTTGTLHDYVSAANLFCSSNYTPGDSIDRETFQDLLRNCWLDLTDADIMDVLQRLLPNEFGGYNYANFLSLCGVNIEEYKNLKEQNVSQDTVQDSSEKPKSVRKNLAASGAFDRDEPAIKEEEEETKNHQALQKLAVRDADAKRITKDAERAWVKEQAVERERKKTDEDEAMRIKLDNAELHEAGRKKANLECQTRKETEQKHLEEEKMQEAKRAKEIQVQRVVEKSAKESVQRQQRAAAIEIQKQVRARRARTNVAQKRNARNLKMNSRRDAAAVTIQTHVRASEARSVAARKRKMKAERTIQNSAAVEIQKHIRARKARSRTERIRINRRRDERYVDERQAKMQDSDEYVYSDEDFDEMQGTGEAKLEEDQELLDDFFDDYTGDEFETGASLAASDNQEQIQQELTNLEDIDNDEYGDDFED